MKYIQIADVLCHIFISTLGLLHAAVCTLWDYYQLASMQVCSELFDEFDTHRTDHVLKFLVLDEVVVTAVFLPKVGPPGGVASPNTDTARMIPP